MPRNALHCAGFFAVVAGLITAACAFAVNLGVENISGYKFWATLTLLERGQAFASYLVYVLINCSLVAASVYITVYHGPAAAGSGIAEVKVRRLISNSSNCSRLILRAPGILMPAAAGPS